MKLYNYDHRYYCHDNNYYSNKAYIHYNTFDEFYSEFGDIDLDYNMIFRFDVRKHEDSDLYYAEIFYMQQRKGKFVPVRIEHYTDKDEEKARELLTRHWEYLKDIWNPISKEVK